MSCPVEVHPHHVGIFTSNLDRAIAWWEEMLGFKKMYENTFFLPDYGHARIAWVKKGDFYIELYDFPGLEADHSRYWKTYGTKHISFWVNDDEFDKLRDYLREKGVPFVVEAEHPPELTGKPGPSKVMFIQDPDGTSVEIQQSYTPGEY
ncbi:MAG: VOC family protein [Thermoleophilia bacterium]|nr:VOC family protein [Thermoleophilia bacterium]